MHIVTVMKEKRNDIIWEEEDNEEKKEEEKESERIKRKDDDSPKENIKMDLNQSELWKPYMLGGKKVFGNPFEPDGRASEFKISPVKAADFFVSCIDVNII